MQHHTNPKSTSDWIVGSMMALFGVIGLIMAGRARDDEIFIFGLSLLAFALLFIGGQMRRHYAMAHRPGAKMGTKGGHHG